MSENMKLWDAFKDVPPEFTKEGTGKGYAFTDINAQWVLRCATEAWGPIGKGWGYKAEAQEVPGRDGSLLARVGVTLWWGEGHEPASFGPVFGACVLQRGDGRWDDDAYKKAGTGALKKALSQVGIGATIHLGQADEAPRDYGGESRPAREPAPARPPVSEEALQGHPDWFNEALPFGKFKGLSWAQITETQGDKEREDARSWFGWMAGPKYKAEGQYAEDKRRNKEKARYCLQVMDGGAGPQDEYMESSEDTPF